VIALNYRGRSRCAGLLACAVAALFCVSVARAASNSVETASTRTREEKSGFANLALQVVGQIQAQQQATLRAVEESTRQNAETVRALGNRWKITIVIGIILAAGLMAVALYVRSVSRSLRHRALPCELSSASSHPANTIGARITSLVAVGEALLEAKQPSRALVCFDEALALDERNADVYVKKGAALEQLGRLEDALTCYDQALTLDVSLSEAYVGKGAVFNRLERYGEALECYEKAARLQPALNLSAIHSLQ